MIRAARWFLTVLLTIGFVCGLIRYLHDDGPDGIRKMVTALVGGIADVTYRWVPPAVNFLGRLTADFFGRVG